MTKLIYVILVTLLIVAPAFSQADADREIARTQKYIEAATKTGNAKITALQSYIKDFPDKTKKWTKLAYYQLAVESFTTEKYADCIKYGEQTLQMGAPGDGEEGRLYLIIANSYAIKGKPTFNEAKAKETIGKAISFATSKKLDDVLGEANKLKKSISAPAPPKMPLDKKLIKVVIDGDYAEAVTIWKQLNAAQKADPEVHKAYANALFKDSKFNAALTEYQALYAQTPSGVFATRLADIYGQKASKDKSLRDKSITLYLEAGQLYKKEGNAGNAKAAYGKARYQMYEKVDYNRRIKAYNEKIKRELSQASKNTEAIKALDKDIRKYERRLYREYESQDLAAPKFERDKLNKMKATLKNLKEGGSAGGDAEGDKLEAERKQIEADLSKLNDDAKKRLGL